VQVIVFIEGEFEGVQPVDFHHIAVFEGGEQGVGWGSHGSQSLNGKDAMIAQCGSGLARECGVSVDIIFD
jgi:hypothetical protein